MTFVAIAGLALLLVWVIPLWVDMRRAYRAKGDAYLTFLRRLEHDAAAGKDGLTLDELKAFLPIAIRPPEGIRGLARVLLAFLIISIIAILTLALLFSSATGVFDIVKQIVTSLLGVLATVIGFYFGARTAEGASASTSPSTSSTTGTGSGGGTPSTGSTTSPDESEDRTASSASSAAQMESPQPM